MVDASAYVDTATILALMICDFGDGLITLLHQTYLVLPNQCFHVAFYTQKEVVLIVLGRVNF
jgi:hypothetical protein